MNGFAGLAPYRSFFFFFLGKSGGFCFQYIGLFFFLVSLPVTILFYFFQILFKNFFGLFIFIFIFI